MLCSKNSIILPITKTVPISLPQRPFYKLMSRELEHNLRSLEILFTLAFNKARQHNLANAYKVYEKNYEKIIQVCY
jgi:hypothetical protein